MGEDRIASLWSQHDLIALGIDESSSYSAYSTHAVDSFKWVACSQKGNVPRRKERRRIRALALDTRVHSKEYVLTLEHLSTSELRISTMRPNDANER